MHIPVSFRIDSNVIFQTSPKKNYKQNFTHFAVLENSVDSNPLIHFHLRQTYSKKEPDTAQIKGTFPYNESILLRFQNLLPSRTLSKYP